MSYFSLLYLSQHIPRKSSFTDEHFKYKGLDYFVKDPGRVSGESVWRLSYQYKYVLPSSPFIVCVELMCLFSYSASVREREAFLSKPMYSSFSVDHIFREPGSPAPARGYVFLFFVFPYRYHADFPPLPFVLPTA